MRLVLACTALSTALACGSAAVPTRQLTSAKAAIRGAEEAGAKEVPKGALHLKMARDNVAKAEGLISDHKELDVAKHLLIRAESDGNLAIVLAKEHSAGNDLAEAQRQLKELSKENE